MTGAIVKNSGIL